MPPPPRFILCPPSFINLSSQFSYSPGTHDSGKLHLILPMYSTVLFINLFHMHGFIYRYTVCNILLYCTVPPTMHATNAKPILFPLVLQLYDIIVYTCFVFCQHVCQTCFVFCQLVCKTCLLILTIYLIRQNLLYNSTAQQYCTILLQVWLGL